MTNISNQIQQAVLVGAIAGLGSKLLLNKDYNAKIFNTMIPVPVIIGGAVAVGDALSGFISPMIFQEIPHVERFKSLESGLVNASISGGAAYLSINFLTNKPVIRMRDIFLLGAASSYIGDALNNQFVDAEESDD